MSWLLVLIVSINSMATMAASYSQTTFPPGHLETHTHTVSLSRTHPPTHTHTHTHVREEAAVLLDTVYV